MRAVALVLIVGVFARYDAVNMLSQMFGMSPPAIYYILGGLWESALAAVILLLSYQMRECIWRRIIRAATIIGIVEGTQASVCRVAVRDIRAVPQGVDLCDYVTGLPFGSVVMSVYFLIICWSVAHESTAA